MLHYLQVTHITMESVDTLMKRGLIEVGEDGEGTNCVHEHYLNIIQHNLTINDILNPSYLDLNHISRD